MNARQLVITGEIWSDGRRLAGPNLPSIGVLVGVLLAVASSGIGPG